MEISPNIPGKQYTFPTYWGGVTVSPEPPMIHAKLRELRFAVGAVAAKKQAGGPQFPVRSAKELMEKLAQALHDLNLVAPVVAQDVRLIDTDKIPVNQTQSGKPVFRTLAHVKSTVRLGAEDGSFVDLVGSGHGGDVDDKAGGKADTYGWKAALLKGLTIGEKDMVDTDDESSDMPASSPSPSLPATKKAPVATTPEQSAGSELEAVLAKVDAAKTSADLDVISKDIQNGKIILAGADKLKASVAFVAKRKLLKAEAEKKE